MPAGFEIQGAQKLLVLSKQLKDAGDKTLQASMRKRLRVAAAPIVAQVKAKAAEHSTTIPRTIVLSMRYSGRGVGAYIISKANRMPAGHEPLPGLFEYKPTFRHPVYGNRKNWVPQTGYPFISVTVLRAAPALRTDLEGIIDDVARTLL